MPRKQAASIEIPLHDNMGLDSKAGPPKLGKAMIPHRAILAEISSGPHAGRSIPEIYRQDVLPAKTRTIPLLGRKSPARILHSLLGYEVQASYKRIQCPDMVTARYLKLFTELGCRHIRLPYDPTVTDKLLPELESAQELLIKGVRGFFPRDRSLQTYVLRHVYSLVRSQLRAD